MRHHLAIAAALVVLVVRVTLGCGTSDPGSPASGADAATGPDAGAIENGATDASSEPPVDAAADAAADAATVDPGLALRAGGLGGAGNADGTGAAARLNNPNGVAVDGAGNLFVADTQNHTIRKITSAGVVTTLAGTAGARGSVDGTGAAARFEFPSGLAVDGAGNVFVADTYNHTIRKITSAGVVTTFAGTAQVTGSADGTGAAARFYSPYSLAVDGAGNVFVADRYNHTIRKITSAGVVSTFAGTAGATGSTDATGAAARFQIPSGVAVDGAGNVFVADRSNQTVRQITAAGVVTTLAGTAGALGTADGAGAAARFYGPNGVAVDAAGNVFVPDSNNHTVRKITSAGVVTTLAGGPGVSGSADGTGAAARFFYPDSVAVDAAGNVFVADEGNHAIRKLSSLGVATTFAGTAPSRGSADATGAAARFAGPGGVSVDGAGNAFVADYSNHAIRKVTSAGVVTTLAGTPGAVGSADGTAAAARFNSPTGVAADGVGNVFVADNANCTIRKITSAGVVTTFAGTAATNGSADGTGAAARFSLPWGVAIDGAGNLFVTDSYNQTVRMITAAGVVTTLAGTPGATGSADGTGAAARFNAPTGVTVDGAGNVFVADSSNHTIRKITSAGAVTTFVGTALTPGSADGTGAAARFNEPNGVAVDGAGNVFVADSGNGTVRMITSAGVVTTLAGVAGRRRVEPGPLPASLNDLGGIALTPSGNLVLTAENSVLDLFFR